jgi:rubredoxin
MPYECPLCGVTSNRKGRPFESIQQVESHIEAKRDDAHAGERAADHRAEIEEADEPNPAASASRSRATDGGATATQQASTTETPESGGLNFTQEEFDEMLEQVRSEAYHDGYEDGKEAAAEDYEQIYQDGYNEGYSDAHEEIEAQQSSSSEDVDCPECGAELYDFSDLEIGKQYEINGVDVVVKGDYQCSQCGVWFTDD